MKKAIVCIGLLAAVCLLACCSSAPKTTVRTVLEFDQEIQPQTLIFVSDAGRYYGPEFGEAFTHHLSALAAESSKNVSFMTYLAFIQSDYNVPEKQGTFNTTLFVFLQGHSSRSGDYGVYGVKYLMEAKYLDQEPFMVLEINLNFDRGLYGLGDSRQGAEALAGTVFGELQSRKVL